MRVAPLGMSRHSDPSSLATDESRLRSIYAIQRILARETGDERSMLQRVCVLLTEHRGYQHVAIRAANPDGSIIDLAASSDAYAQQEVGRWDDTPLGQGTIGRALRTGTAVAAALEELPNTIWRDVLAEAGATHIISLPFHLDDTLGVLTAFAAVPDGFTEDEVDLLQGLADHIGGTIDNTRMRALLFEQRDRAQRSDTRLRALWNLAAVPTADFDEQAHAIILEGVRGLGFAWGAISRVNGGALHIDFVVSDGEIPRAGEVIPLDIALSAPAIANGQPWFANDLREIPIVCDAPPVRDGLRSFIATTFVVDGVTYVLDFGASYTLARPLDDDDLSYVDLLASFFARAMQHREDEARIRYLQDHDALTGLRNREAFRERLDIAVARAQRTNTRFALLRIDLDRFRDTIADVGTAAGDEIIAEVARRLTAQIRAGEELFRDSGDAFTIILPDLPSAEDADALARDIVSAIGEPVDTGHDDVHISASVGMSIFPDDGPNAHALHVAASSALVRAKRGGRSEFRFFSAALDERLADRRRLIEDLKRSVSRNEIVVHYQPWIDLRTRAVGGVEALARWPHPTRGMLGPDAFISLAEETDIIHDLGAFIFSQAARQATHFRDMGFPLAIAVNVSARQFSNPQLVAEMHGALLRHGTDPHAMEIEITESWTMRDPKSATRTLGSLRDLGVKIAIDDFGIGHSSLGYLKHFPIDIIKIDQLFVRGLPDEQADAAIARAIIALATSIGCETRAEGVESSDQAVWLAAAGCRTAQGFLYSPALSSGEIDGWLAERRLTKPSPR